jgi:hypothetical protein
LAKDYENYKLSKGITGIFSKKLKVTFDWEGFFNIVSEKIQDRNQFGTIEEYYSSVLLNFNSIEG